MHDVAVNCVRSKDAQKQLARTSLRLGYRTVSDKKAKPTVAVGPNTTSFIDKPNKTFLFTHNALLVGSAKRATVNV